MPRVARIAPGGMTHHVFNRGNGGKPLFKNDREYQAFVSLLAEVKENAPMRILAYCIMPDHWHLVLWPKKDGDLSRFMLRLTTTHVRRHHAARGDAGHIYQGRFKNFPIQEDSPLLDVMRFVEGNPRRSKAAKLAEKWQWSSLHARQNEKTADWLDKWPVKRPSNWLKLVNTPPEPRELEAFLTSVNRGRPFGSPEWVKRTADKLGLGYSIRPRGRPPGKAKNKGKKK